MTHHTMSGKRQHFVPQFLQRGFASHAVGDEAFTWVYRKGTPPFNPNIKNVGAESSFYTQEDDTLADDLITKAEGSLGELVERLRSSPPSAISDAQVPTLIAHLEVRTRHLRQSWLQSVEYLISQFISFMADEDSFLDFLERKMRNDPSMVRTVLLEGLTKRGLPLSMLGPLMKVVPSYIPVWRAQLKSSLPKFIAYLRANLPRIARDATKSGHIKALKGSISPEVKTERYKDLLYTTVDLSDASLILGD
jgi:hypothetical protein